jgi:hypothetical protein
MPPISASRLVARGRCVVQRRHELRARELGKRVRHRGEEFLLGGGLAAAGQASVYPGR